MRGDAVFCGAVHFPSAYLYLKGDALGADDSSVNALIHVRLRGRDIILESARDGLEHIVDYAQHIIAVGYRIDYNAERTQVKYTIDIELLRVHFAIDAVNVLYTAVNRDLKPFVGKALFYLHLNV